MMKIQRDIQIDAIKKRECFKVTKYEGYALITDGIYGVYVNDEDLLLNPDKFNDVADKESFDRYEMEDSEGVKVLNEAITLERETANAVINYKKEKWWIWNKTIKKFGKKAQYEIKRKIIEKKGKQEESVIVVVRNEETYDIVEIIPIIRNIEEMKNETYQL